jgi:hypothetical protein
LFTVSRPIECPDRTEIEYLRRKNMAEAQRGVVYPEDAFESETARELGAAQPEPEPEPEPVPAPKLRITIPPRAASLPIRLAADSASASRDENKRPYSAPVVPQRLAVSSKTLAPSMRARSRKAFQKAYLRQSPKDWSEYDVPDAEYFVQQTFADELRSALEKVIEEEKMGGQEESREGRVIENDQEVEGEWYGTIEEALEVFSK